MNFPIRVCDLSDNQRAILLHLYRTRGDGPWYVTIWEISVEMDKQAKRIGEVVRMMVRKGIMLRERVDGRYVYSLRPGVFHGALPKYGGYT